MASDVAQKEKARIENAGFLIAIVIAFVLAAMWTIPTLLDDRSVPERIENRINPNTASAQSLSRLPGIGPTRAESIVIFRSRRLAEDANDIPFRYASDLEKVRGIGEKTAQSIAPYLRFE